MERTETPTGPLDVVWNRDAGPDGERSSHLDSTAAELEVAHLVRRASETGITLATAESLTAGLLAARVADVPGASAVLRGGVVSYAVDVKAAVLGVDPGRLATHGPVDDVVAEQMAAGVLRLMNADLAISTTGVAGPEPHGGHGVGTVYIGWATRRGTGHRLFSFDGSRAQVRQAAVREAVLLALEAMPSGD
ncbi:CinA family protein [Galactobacter caseinivorans]|uniref:CinA family protein n=1 Tax=Galactobacter caseinivorans TaxID=2676123 RepID=UPI001F35D70A|nr:CinA family protein [Galactobacter caseinivorans]